MASIASKRGVIPLTQAPQITRIRLNIWHRLTMPGSFTFLKPKYPWNFTAQNPTVHPPIYSELKLWKKGPFSIQKPTVCIFIFANIWTQYLISDISTEEKACFVFDEWILFIINLKLCTFCDTEEQQCTWFSREKKFLFINHTYII